MATEADQTTRKLARLLAERGHFRLAVRTVLFNAKTKLWKVKMTRLDQKRKRLLKELEDLEKLHLSVFKD